MSTRKLAGMIRPEEWSPVDGLQLESNALKAVRETRANVVVTAGPGAGKTELLAQRADFLFRTGASPYPKRILAISFKRDAAHNLRSRVSLRSGPQYAYRFDSLTFHAFAKRIIDNYRPALTGKNALDPDYRIGTDRTSNKAIAFDDLVPLAREILQKNVYARGALRQTYSHVFMDEFQDATAEQYEFMKEAFADTDVLLTGVGDTKQRIMGFAGALEGIMATFADDFAALELQLYQNFRSKPRLRRMQNRMITAMDPSAASPDEDLLGEGGELKVLRYENDVDEAAGVTQLITGWIREGVQPREIAVIVRKQPHLIAEVLMRHLNKNGVACRNEQQSQDLTTEPVAALIFNFLRVVVGTGNPAAYSELVRMVTRDAFEEDDAVQASKLLWHLNKARMDAQSPGFDVKQFDSWMQLIKAFLKFVSRSAVNALSPSYQQGDHLDEVLKKVLGAYERELKITKDPIAALARLSEADAVRILTIHKCKGLEFEKVIVLGVEEQFYWGKEDDVQAVFFVAISRAKEELVLTTALQRQRPCDANRQWCRLSRPCERLLDYAKGL
ncbi:ATP-dependent helicase [Pseudoglutamicibacter albus]|uniref:DNA 3'-5' helicase n=1 Tax=Pseudoglutamicibacter albus TaxID=98671 RepID=A0ABU1YX62_9MICC|nr:ATP-dependent helicase [Pseudoglutamicibacter albus]MDR7292808.1 superfamily I DNA/RNA helicase [Pseudoglutamicibacter albus]